MIPATMARSRNRMISAVWSACKNFLEILLRWQGFRIILSRVRRRDTNREGQPWTQGIAKQAGEVGQGRAAGRRRVELDLKRSASNQRPKPVQAGNEDWRNGELNCGKRIQEVS